MDEIAALAAVSKQTVYKHFADKERLFSEIVVSTVNEASEPTHDVAAAFERLAKRGVLQVDDPPLAAAHFNWLIMSIPLNQAMLSGRDEPPAPADLDRYVDSGVRVFLAAYGRR
jgi:AcrR family transcriptional regulator